MTWTAPMTFAANQVLTAAQMNTFLRDNMLETEAAKATVSGGGYFVAQAKNTIVQRRWGTQRIATAESVSSLDFTDLTTEGPTVTVTTGSRCIVVAGARIENNFSDSVSRLSYAVSGATSINAGATGSLMTWDGITAANPWRHGGTHFHTNLTPGENTFTMKYATASLSNTATYADRFLAIMPL